MNDDYRDSHTKQGKGASYDKTFSELPYRAVLWQMEQRFLLQILKLFNEKNKINHLDFACGTGRILNFLAKHVSTSTGVDLSDSMLEIAHQQAPSTELLNADITRDDTLNNRTFNLITAFRFFPNAQPELRSKAMKALVKHLADDGRIVFNNHRNLSSTYFGLVRLVKLSNDIGIGMSQEEVRALVKSAGLEIEKIYHVGVLPLSDTHNLLPPFIINLIERPASAFPLFRSLSQDLIYVCKRTTDKK
jgi:predicted TPR repeat methyltransferase